MRPMYNDDQSQPESTTKEPLADINLESPHPVERQPGSRPRRKRLSDVDGEVSEAPAPPQAKPQYRRSLAMPKTDSGGPPSDSQTPPPPLRPRLANIPKEPEEIELRPRAGHLAVTMTQPCAGVPGLLNILDPLQAISETPAMGQNGAKRASPEQQARRALSIALVAGIAAAVVAALVWALMTLTTGYHVGWMTLGIGLLVGGAVRTTGRSASRSFGAMAAAIAVFGCLLGNLLSVCAMVAGQEDLAPLKVLAHLCAKPDMIPAATIATFQPLDLLFCAVAVYAGYRLAFRRTASLDMNDDNRLD
jgi:hypothetical protein